MIKNINDIPLLNPLNFKDKFIEPGWNPPDTLEVNEFFIHSFKDETVPLKLPLPLHKMTVNDFVLITGGRMTKTIGLESFSLKANQFLFTPKNSITTTTELTDNLQGFYCHFADDFIFNNSILNQWNTQPVIHNLLNLTKEEMEILISLLKRLVSLYHEIKNRPFKLQLLQYYLSTFIAEVYFIAEGKALKPSFSSLVLKFQQLVNQHFKESKSVQFYANQLHVSPNHLNKMVKSETGKSASNFIHSICILEAKVLLLQTDSDINQIANELGFEDVAYFSRFFKKYAGHSPSDYRRMIDLS